LQCTFGQLQYYAKQGQRKLQWGSDVNPFGC
jgi:hypothetical protein